MHPANHLKSKSVHSPHTHTRHFTLWRHKPRHFTTFQIFIPHFPSLSREPFKAQALKNLAMHVGWTAAVVVSPKIYHLKSLLHHGQPCLFLILQTYLRLWTTTILHYLLSCYSMHLYAILTEWNVVIYKYYSFILFNQYVLNLLHSNIVKLQSTLLGPWFQWTLHSWQHLNLQLTAVLYAISDFWIFPKLLSSLSLFLSCFQVKDQKLPVFIFLFSTPLEKL